MFVPIFFGLATLCGITADMCMMVFLRNMKRASGYNSMFTVVNPVKKLSYEFFYVSPGILIETQILE